MNLSYWEESTIVGYDVSEYQNAELVHSYFVTDIQDDVLTVWTNALVNDVLTQINRFGDAMIFDGIEAVKYKARIRY